MSATLGINHLSVERIGIKVEVPNNNLARLMYYLSCIFTVIQYNDNKELSEYKHYYNLNQEQKKTVYALAVLFDPKIFLGAKIFILDNGALTGDFGNEFFKITDERVGVHVNQEIMIGGHSVKVLKIMACKTSWLEKNYYNPLRGLYNELNNRSVSYNSYNNTSSRVLVTQPTTYYITTNERRSDFDWCKCILYTLLCIYCGPIFWIYLCFCRDNSDS